MKKWIVTILILALFPISIFAGREKEYGFVVIINPKNPVKSMTKSEVKLTYLRKINKRWPGINKNIVPVDRKDMPDFKRNFLSDLINMSAQDMSRYFTERQYMNAEMPPITFGTDEEIVDYVANNIGAIGYISIGSLTESTRNKVKVVFP